MLWEDSTTLLLHARRWVPTLLRLGRGMVRCERAAAEPPAQLLRLWSYESNQFARLVRARSPPARPGSPRAGAVQLKRSVQLVLPPQHALRYLTLRSMPSSLPFVTAHAHFQARLMA